MPDTKTSALTDGVTANGTDVIPAARAGANVGLLISYIAAYFLGLTNTFAQNLSIAASKSLIIQSAFALFGPSDGVMVLSNTGFSGFARLNFGGTTSSFPALKVSSTSLSVRLADDSTDAGLIVGSLRINVAPSSVGTGTKTISNSADSTTNFGHYLALNLNGTTYYVPCSATAPT